MFEALPNPPLTADTVAASTQECTVLKEVYAAIQEGNVQKLKAPPPPRHRSVVGNKRTDVAPARRKRDSWKKIEDEFNSRHNVTPRKWTQLKKCWENLKDKWRRTNAEDMRERFATGGGTPPSSQMTYELQRVKDITSHMAVRLPNPCDSDRSRHDAMPGGSQSSNQLSTPSVAALRSQTAVQRRKLVRALRIFFIAHVLALLS
ncbi:hypothetical protein MTO96_040896 [Rhipicephalus appendiculatus]